MPVSAAASRDAVQWRPAAGRGDAPERHHRPVRGPAAGVVGAIRQAARSGRGNLITFDMGGTSTDVCLVEDGQPSLASETEIDGLPIRTPVLDIVSVGAGGGSIVWIDDGRHAARRSAQRRRRSGAGLLRPGRHRAHHHRRACRARHDPARRVPRRRAWRSTPPRPRAPSSRSRGGFGLTPEAAAVSAVRSPTPTSCAPSSSSRPSAAAIRATTRWCRSAAPARCMPPQVAEELGIRPSWCRPMPA